MQQLKSCLCGIAAALIFASGAMLPARAAAQESAPAAAQGTQPAKLALPGRNVLSINPLGVVFNVFSGEYERAVGGNVSVGVASTLWRSSQEFDDADGSADATVTYVSADAKLRYYPTVALRGFSVGGLVGATRLGGELRACPNNPGCEEVRGHEVALSAGVELDYTWRVGDTQKFVIATGIGAKRLYPLNENVDVTLAYPFARLSIGIGF